jgi:formylglycine-generating enzyme required for sulfatase activity
MRTKLFALALTFILLALLPPPARTQERGLNIRVEDGKDIKLYDKSYALVIGVNDYVAGWPKLPGVKKDIEEVARALELHGFQVTKVENPDSAQLDKSFRDFIDAYGQGTDNRLLFYFAGHGHTLKQSYGEEMGYVVPVDAPNPNTDQVGFRSKAMSMEQMELYAKRIQSKHALFLFDSCFSGSLLAITRAIPENIGYKTSRPVRQFITSGSADERVPDKSIFREQFISALEGEADRDKDGYVTGTELGMFLQDKVINYSRNAQHPQYGTIRNPNLDKGDFVFALPKAASAPAVAASRAPTAQPTQPARVDPAQQELAFWNSVQNSKDPDDFKDYLEKYPAGLYTGIARRKLAALTSVAKPAPWTPAGGGAASNTTSGAWRPSSPKPGSAARTRNGIELVYVPPGEFMMGSENGEAVEKPVHRVTIREGFYMGKYEVTQAQWQAVMGNNPSYFKGDNLPVEKVSWDDAISFIAKLNAHNNGYTYRLPSEAEWEYACRAGTTGDHAGALDSLAWYGNNSGRQYLDVREIAGTDSVNFVKRLADNGNQTHPVGAKQPNAFGLFDMHGNVWEWCHDWYHDDYNGAPSDGRAWESGGEQKYRVLRGGSWTDFGTNCDSTDRYWPIMGDHKSFIGFRVVAVART